MTITARQQRNWDNALQAAKALNLKINALVLRAETMAEAIRIGGPDFDLPEAHQFISSVQVLQQRDTKIQRIMAAVMTNDLGVRFHGDEIDVMAGPGTNDDELIQYQGLEGLLLIITGVVVVGSLVAALIHEHNEANRSRNYYRPMYVKANEIFQREPNSARSQEWFGYVASQQHQLKKGTWERLEDQAKAILQQIVTGAKWGIAIAVPLIALMLYARFSGGGKNK